jgi:hypothetical protein
VIDEGSLEAKVLVWSESTALRKVRLVHVDKGNKPMRTILGVFSACILACTVTLCLGVWRKTPR